MGYFGKPNKIIEEISAINRGCKVYDALTKYLRQMPNEDPGSIILYYNMARNVLFSSSSHESYVHLRIPQNQDTKTVYT